MLLNPDTSVGTVPKSALFCRNSDASRPALLMVVGTEPDSCVTTHHSHTSSVEQALTTTTQPANWLPSHLIARETKVGEQRQRQQRRRDRSGKLVRP